MVLQKSLAVLLFFGSVVVAAGAHQASMSEDEVKNAKCNSQ